MKKYLLIGGVVVLGLILAGCQTTNKASNTDNADNALLQEDSASPPQAPPMPPSPSQTP